MTNMTIKRLTSITIFAGLLITGTAEQSFADGYAGEAGAFLRMGSGAAALGSGDAGVARAMGAEQAHYNPAGLPFAPYNDIAVGYHILSLDRSLSHVSALLQVPELGFWEGPMRPVAAIKLREEEITGSFAYTLVYPDETPGPYLAQYRVNQFLDALVETIVTHIEHGDETTEDALIFDARGFSPGVLQPLIDDIVAIAQTRQVSSREDILALLKTKYQRVQKKPAAIALTWTHGATDNIEGRDSNGQYYGDLGFYENRFALSFGLKLHRTVSIGITAGVLHARIPSMLENETESMTSTTFGADLGLQLRPFAGSETIGYHLETLSLGAAVYDLNAKNSWNSTGLWSQGTTKEDKFPKRYRFGMEYQPVAGIKTFFDVETDLKDRARPKGGVEVALFQRHFSAALGTSNGKPLQEYGLILRTGIDRDRPTFGLGLNIPLGGLGMTRLDYAYVVEPVSPEPTQVLSWRFRFSL